MAIYGCGFISKEAVKSIPCFGTIAQGLQSIFLEKNNANSRKDVLEKKLKGKRTLLKESQLYLLWYFQNVQLLQEDIY